MNPLKKQTEKEEIGEGIKELQERLLLAEKERDEYLNGWKRAKADLVNFKKETAAAIVELSDVARANFIKNLLPILDALEESAKNKIEGLENIRVLVMNILRKEGIKEIEAKAGDKFNPELHEALDGKGTVIQEVLQKGYLYKGKIIRVARVEVREVRKEKLDS